MIPTFHQIDVFCIRSKSFTFNLKVTDSNITTENDILEYCDSNNLLKGRLDIDEIQVNDLTEDEFKQSVGRKITTIIQLFKVEAQLYPDGPHVCVVYANGDWFCDCGLEGDVEAEDKAILIVTALNKFGKVNIKSYICNS